MKTSFRELLSRYKVPLIVIKILLSFAPFAYVGEGFPAGTRSAPRMSVTRWGPPRYFYCRISSEAGFGPGSSARRASQFVSESGLVPFRQIFFNNFLPSNIGGDITRISDAAKHADHVSPVFSATVMDRLIGVLAMALVAVVASFAAIDRIHLYAIYTAIVIVFIVSLGLFLSIFNRTVLKAFEWPFRVIGARTIERGIRRLMDDLHGYKHQVKVLRLVFAASLSVQVSRIMVHYVVGLALGVHVAVGYYFLFVPALAALVSLPISLNGLGVREGAGVVLFHMAGMTKEQAFTVPFLTYLISVVISLLGGLIFVSRTPRRALQGVLERRRTARAAAGGRARKGID
jgi:uncharacterized protein (TIRG00374 family)